MCTHLRPFGRFHFFRGQNKQLYEYNDEKRGNKKREYNIVAYFVFKPLSANDNEVIFFKATMHAWFNESTPNEVKLAAET